MSKFSFFSLFGNSQPALRPVSDILSSFQAHIAELKNVISSHTTKIAENDAKIEALEAANQTSQDEIEQATAAHTNLSALIGVKLATPVTPVGDQ